MNIWLRRSHAAFTSGCPQPWCVRVRSAVVPVNGHGVAVLMISAFIVVLLGRLSNTVAPGAGLPNDPADHIW